MTKHIFKISWGCNHIIERFKAWWKIANWSRTLLLEDVEKERLMGSIFTSQFHFLLIKLPQAAKPAECKMMCFSVSLSIIPDAPQHFWSSRIVNKNILNHMKSSSECYRILVLDCWKIRAAGTTSHGSKSTPVHLNPDTGGVITHNVYID
jgi:hypothetical protein